MTYRGKNFKRDREIVKLVLNGESLRLVGKKFNITGGRVHQIVLLNNLKNNVFGV